MLQRLAALSILALALAVAAPAAHAGGTACYTWSCDKSTGVCTVNASCSTASPYVYKYEVEWGDGTSTGQSGSAVNTHTYGPTQYDALVTVRITFFSGTGTDTATCYIWPRVFPLFFSPSSGSCS